MFTFQALASPTESDLCVAGNLPAFEVTNEVNVIEITLDEREREMFYLTTHSTHFIYGYMASDIWLRTILIVRK